MNDSNCIVCIRPHAQKQLSNGTSSGLGVCNICGIRPVGQPHNRKTVVSSPPRVCGMHRSTPHSKRKRAPRLEQLATHHTTLVPYSYLSPQRAQHAQRHQLQREGQVGHAGVQVGVALGAGGAAGGDAAGRGHQRQAADACRRRDTWRLSDTWRLRDPHFMPRGPSIASRPFGGPGDVSNYNEAGGVGVVVKVNTLRLCGSTCMQKEPKL